MKWRLFLPFASDLTEIREENIGLCRVYMGKIIFLNVYRKYLEKGSGVPTA